MLTLEEIIARLKDRKPTVVAQQVGMRPGTIIDIAKGRVVNPSYETVEKLSAYLSGN